MDSSTVSLVGTLVVAFVFIRWFLAAEVVPPTDADAPRQPARPAARHHVTQGMVEVVQSLAPHISPAQIRLDLERTGLVQATVDRILDGTVVPLPVAAEPKGSAAPVAVENLAAKLGLADDAGAATAVPAGWLEDKDERARRLQLRRQEMVLKARQRMAALLLNRTDLPLR